MGEQSRLVQQQEQIMVRVMKDDAFRQELLADPKTVLERELGMTFPPGVGVQAHEDTPSMLHLVLPMAGDYSEMVELTEAQREQVEGGTVGCDVCGYIVLLAFTRSWAWKNAEELNPQPLPPDTLEE
jgi:hypothetical protein